MIKYPATLVLILQTVAVNNAAGNATPLYLTCFIANILKDFFYLLHTALQVLFV